MNLSLERIVIYPIKALDGVSVQEARISAGGSLEGDRSFAFFNAEGKAVNGKREPRLMRLRTQFDPALREVLVRPDGRGAGERFALEERGVMEAWLAGFLGYRVELRRDGRGGFPDDRQAYGPTVASSATMARVASWFPGMDAAGARRRFRANLELGGAGAEPFCEDALFGPADTLKPFRIGQVAFDGHNPCQRCPVPTRDPDTGEAWDGFKEVFVERRRDSLPAWAEPSRFNHYYRLAVNTSIPPSEAGKTLRLEDALGF